MKKINMHSSMLPLFPDATVNEQNPMEFQGCGLELWPIWLTEHFDAGGDYVAWWCSTVKTSQNHLPFTNLWQEFGEGSSWGWKILIAKDVGRLVCLLLGRFPH